MKPIWTRWLGAEKTTGDGPWVIGNGDYHTQLGYLVPLSVDLPKINTLIVETMDPHGPYEAKEAEMSVARSSAQAYSRAISNAIGVYFKEFPLTPDKILEAIRERNK